MPAVPNVIQCAHVCVIVRAQVIYEYMHVCECGAELMCVCVCVCASCQLPRSAANPPWLVPTGNWAQTGAKQTQEGNMAHGNPPSLSPILLHSSLSDLISLSTLINCFFLL